jgi:glycosyltransferase involved in cell wall biosynthesis
VLRVLVLSNMAASAAHPERGRFVRDQVRELASEPDLAVEMYEFEPGPRALLAAATDLRRRYRGVRFDIVHAHFGLTAWAGLTVRCHERAVTLHGTDVSHPRTRQLTRLVLPRMGLVCAASQALVDQIPGARARERARVLPCGVDLDRFRPIDRGEARAALELDPKGPYLLFAADPTRAAKRYDRAVRLAGQTRLLTLGGVEPQRVPLFVNAANAVLVPSEREGFGLAVLEALACDVPVLATPVGAHPLALAGVDGALCAPFDVGLWRTALEEHLRATDPRIEGRSSAERFSAQAMAGQLAQHWRLLSSAGRVA